MRLCPGLHRHFPSTRQHKTAESCKKEYTVINLDSLQEIEQVVNVAHKRCSRYSLEAVYLHNVTGSPQQLFPPILKSNLQLR